MKGLSSRQLLVGLWIALIMALLFLWYFPVVSFTSRIALLTVAFLLIVESVILVWKRRALRWGFLAFCAIAMGFILLPSDPGKGQPNLRALYSEALASYSGCPYVWGGEGRFGIDCSGLVRRGLEDAFVRHGFRTMNPYWIRQSVSLWWHDTTAQMLGTGYGGRTREVTMCRKLNDLDHSILLPGDLAVSPSGIHVMVYLGNQTWIEADPAEGKVLKFTIPNEKNGYGASPMRIMRWTIFGEKWNSSNAKG